MFFFIADDVVAKTLDPTATWRKAELDGFDVVGGGILAPSYNTAQGVVGQVQQAQAVLAYQDSLPGQADEIEVICDGQIIVARAIVGAKSGQFDGHARLVEAYVAADVVRIAAAPTDHNLPIFRPGLVMRARSQVRAAQSGTDVSLRQGLGMGDVSAELREMPYARYFDVEEITLRHRRFSGEMSEPVVRTVLRSADAVTVLPYDPVRDMVVMVEQFRPGAFARGDSHPWVLEPVAGRCDGDEPVEEVARREMIEEAGLDLIRLEKISGYYPSPGCLSEYLYSFVGLVDLSNAAAGVHGLDAEGEDIRTHFIPFETAFDLIRTGEAENGPLVLSLYWLAAHRTRLRQDASAA